MNRRLRPDARQRLAVWITEFVAQDPFEAGAPDYALADEVLELISEREAGGPIPGMRHLGDGTYRVGPLAGQRVRSPITGRFKKGQSPKSVEGDPDAG